MMGRQTKALSEKILFAEQVINASPNTHAHCTANMMIYVCSSIFQMQTHRKNNTLTHIKTRPIAFTAHQDNTCKKTQSLAFIHDEYSTLHVFLSISSVRIKVDKKPYLLTQQLHNDTRYRKGNERQQKASPALYIVLF